MRLVMMGMGPFAAPTLRQLYESRHEVTALVTRPPRPIHGKNKTAPHPVREWAVEHGTLIFEPESINSPEARMLVASCRCDLFVVCDYGQILSKETLEVARLGGINLHASMLPKYRGAAPINWALYHGETTTGVTIIHMTPQLDAGPAIVQLATPIGAEETAPELEVRLSELGAPAVLQAIELLESNSAVPIPQDPSKVTKAPRLTKELGQVDWKRTAHEIANQVRALKPWPGTYTFWCRGEGEPLRLIIDRATAVSGPADTPGKVISTSDDQLVIATGEGDLAITQLQPAGKRTLTAAEFLNGYPLKHGEILGH